MTLIRSISGIRGTIGNHEGENLTPPDIVKFASAFAAWLKERNPDQMCKVVIGRDARPSGRMVSDLVSATLTGCGVDVMDCGLSTTPTVEMEVTAQGAHGGIVLTASHNPVQWNALKLLNEKGEFLSAQDGARILDLVENASFQYAEVNDLGQLQEITDAIERHIDRILELDTVDADLIRDQGLKVVVDAVNSTGGIAIPALLERLGVEVVKLYCEPNGQFPHNPEPLPEHLEEISKQVVEQGADLGVVVDPDVDRLALVNPDGSMFGEEYTLVAVADHILSEKGGRGQVTVSNMSSSLALRDVSARHEAEWTTGMVGEVNVVETMKDRNAIIGGEGNGGVILPSLHYGRDALAGLALVLTLLAKRGCSLKDLRDGYPNYEMAKKKIQLDGGTLSPEDALAKVKAHYNGQDLDERDGVKVILGDEWVHLRKSNTEPIVRVYAESGSKEKANALADSIIKLVLND